jgi:hypothetical protein
MDRYTELLFYGKHVSLLSSGPYFTADGWVSQVSAAAASARVMIANPCMGPRWGR